MSYRRLLAAWLLLAVLMPLNGIARELGLKRLLDHGLADVLSAILGVLIILIVTRTIFRIAPGTRLRRLLGMGALLAAMTIAFETTIGRLEGKSWEQLLTNYAFWRGRLWPFVLLTLAATPLVWGLSPRTRSSPSPPDPG
ncbi:MAG: hypothetical protein KF689_02280 [Gemmatimonadaceae bacterium]|nr:hypothetical protein [Gemmatimonadaceae bacterium]MCW5826763.1 hypothetical protein [Gemmatimonadaceae bacterium]